MDIPLPRNAGVPPLTIGLGPSIAPQGVVVPAWLEFPIPKEAHVLRANNRFVFAVFGVGNSLTEKAVDLGLGVVLPEALDIPITQDIDGIELPTFGVTSSLTEQAYNVVPASLELPLKPLIVGQASIDGRFSFPVFGVGSSFAEPQIILPACVMVCSPLALPCGTPAPFFAVR